MCGMPRPTLARALSDTVRCRGPRAWRAAALLAALGDGIPGIRVLFAVRGDFLTRVATLPGLAALGANKDEIAKLRAAMIGTPVVRGAREEPLPGEKLQAFIKAVDEHDSYAAKSYYLKFYRSYFAGMERSFAELARVVKPGASLVFVAQDSWFKQLHVPVPELLAEMGERRGWEVNRHDYPVVWNRAGMHPHGRTYRSSTRAVESVLIFRAA
jgi:hypothetical protein